MNMNTITIKVKKSEKKRLNQIAMRYGLSLPELAKKVLLELREQFKLESFADYKNPRQLKNDVENALREYKQGKFITKL